MKFSEMPYERADAKLLGEQYIALTEKVKNAKNADEVIEAIKEHEELSKNFGTMVSLAYVRHTIDTADAFYSAENDYYDENTPVVTEHTHAFMLSIFSSPFRAELEKELGSLVFINMEMALKAFSPEIVPDLQEENRLTSEYQKLIASAQIDYDGKTLNISQLGAYKQNPDREKRHGAYLAESGFYMSHAEELDELFDKLVKCRTAMAKKLGYNSYTELAYLIRNRNCYNSEMVKFFREQVKRDLVPTVMKMKKMQSERIGIPDMYIYDDLFGYKEGNPKPMGTPEDILAAGKRMYEEMSPETAEFINYMYDNELLDVVAKKGKAVGGYCTDFPKYGAPFIFSNFNGTSGDVDVLTHEAGHAYAAYRVRDFKYLENASPTMESCEVHSMSMEFFAWKWLNLFYGDQTERQKFLHLGSALEFIPYGSMVDDFQHIVYDNPELTPEQRNEAWLKLEKEYRPYMKFGDVPFYALGRGWQRQLHIYQNPFYYIDYCFAQTESLVFWNLSQSDYADAWKRYNAFVNEGGKKTFVDLCKTAGIDDPFTEGTLKRISDTAAAWLGV